MKLFGVEIPSDIEIPEVDPVSKAEIDEMHASTIREREESERRRKDPRFAWFFANMKTAPLPPDADKPYKFDVKKLRLLSPWARARTLYGWRDHLTD
ncbi:hypothetical protein GTP46_00945 [Duganella sp. FT135W]|uniref:Uncharacterized protein n=1 Tax=Duganella flavida TaxID=2692175 RepID=A0A6L8K2T2_9BURK|nr:hypothetical protein [Duganella flavida]MYM21215.1 hypothetical protein [Duganella flavida]